MLGKQAIPYPHRLIHPVRGLQQVGAAQPDRQRVLVIPWQQGCQTIIVSQVLKLFILLVEDFSLTSQGMDLVLIECQGLLVLFTNTLKKLQTLGRIEDQLTTFTR